MKTITIIVDPMGQTEIETTGFTGEACRDATRQLERALGVSTSETLTTEYHAAQATSEQNHRLGFGLVAPYPAAWPDEADDCPPQVIDWDDVDAERHFGSIETDAF